MPEFCDANLRCTASYIQGLGTMCQLVRSEVLSNCDRIIVILVLFII